MRCEVTLETKCQWLLCDVVSLMQRARDTHEDGNSDHWKEESGKMHREKML